ncbi:uncharacterized protein [Cardiocondyla obscurior]|uniref:uncharacterized protein n=1 Tax=Cardiocondyla obscurior TaxID=286306 RepID=UPI003965631B
MTLQGRAITWAYIYSSDMVAQSGKAGDEEPTEELTGKLPECCSGNSKNNTHGGTTSGAVTLFTNKQDRIPRKYQEERTAEVLIPSRSEWRKADFLNGLGLDVWFKDGSGKDNRHGAGIYGRGNRSSLPLGEYATVFQAEIIAIAECARIQITNQTNSKRIYIWSDSRAAINALVKQSTESIIHGNEVADELAKQETRTKEFLAMSRQKLRAGIGLLTGHETLRGHLHNLGIVEHYKCRLCEEENEDSIHILCHCPVLAIKRYLFWVKMFTDTGQIKEARVNSLISLGDHAGLRTKIHPR